jgi:hypothetical protein
LCAGFEGVVRWGLGLVVGRFGGGEAMVVGFVLLKEEGLKYYVTT